MNSLISFFIVIACGVGGFWLALFLYGLVRKDKKSDRRRSRVGFTETGDSDGGGGGDGGGH